MFQKYKADILLFKRLIQYIKPYKLIFFIGLFLTILISLVGPLRPLLIIEMVNEFIAGSNHQPKGIELFFKNFVAQYHNENPLTIWLIIILVLLLLEGIVQFVLAYLGEYLGQSIIRDVRVKLFKHIQSFKVKYFDTTPNGTI